MPEREIHGKSGGRGEVGCLRDGNGGALKIGNGGGVDLGFKHGAAIVVERKGVLFDVDQEVPVQGEEED
jgi:hypothetical protein